MFLDNNSEVKTGDKARKMFEQLKALITSQAVGSFDETFNDVLTSEFNSKVCHLDIVLYAHMKLIQESENLLHSQLKEEHSVLLKWFKQFETKVLEKQKDSMPHQLFNEARNSLGFIQDGDNKSIKESADLLSLLTEANEWLDKNERSLDEHS